MKNRRPYADANRKIQHAWAHLKKRRTRGDNEARRLLRGISASMFIEIFDETLTNDYIPAITKHLNQPTRLLAILGRKPRRAS